MRVGVMVFAMVLGAMLGLGPMSSWAESPAPVVLDDEALAEITGAFTGFGSTIDSALISAKNAVIGAVFTAESRTDSALLSAESRVLGSICDVE